MLDEFEPYQSNCLVKVYPRKGGLGGCCVSYGAFTLDVKSVLNENLGGILGGTQC